MKWLLSAAAVLILAAALYYGLVIRQPGVVTPPASNLQAASPQRATPPSCPVEQAQYRMTVPGQSGEWQLAFVPARHMAGGASDLYLRLTTSQRDYWFTFSMAQGYGGISVLPVSVPGPGVDPHPIVNPYAKAGAGTEG